MMIFYATIGYILSVAGLALNWQMFLDQLSEDYPMVAPEEWTSKDALFVLGVGIILPVGWFLGLKALFEMSGAAGRIRWWLRQPLFRRNRKD